MYNRQLEKLCRTRLDDVLLDEGLTERSHVEDAQAESEVTGQLLSQILFDREILDEWDLAKLMARHYSLPFLSLGDYSVPEEALTLLPQDFCRENCLVPVERFGPSVAIAVSELPSVPVLKQLETMLRSTPFVYVAQRSAILTVIEDMDPEAYAPLEAEQGAQGAVGAANLQDLPGITMRLGYSMHARASQGASSSPGAS